MLLSAVSYTETVKWRIDSDALVQYLQAYKNVEADTNYAVWPGDPIWVYHNSANITILCPDGWTFELVPYSDDSTPFGIRFRPLEIDEGWLFLGFWPEGFSYDEEEVTLTEGPMSTTKSIFGTSRSDGSFRFRLYTGLGGDYAVVSQGAEGWYPEYSKEVSTLLSWTYLGIGIPTRQQAMEAAGFAEEEVTMAGFDWVTGRWTVWGTNADGMYGKVIDRNGQVVDELFPKEGSDAPAVELHRIAAEPKVVYYETLEELEAASDYILRVKRLGDAEPQFTRNGNAVTAVQTLSQVEVLEVFKEPYDTLSPGDTLTVLEYAAWDEETRTMYHTGDYILMEEGSTYLLFLMETGTPWLAPVGFWEGVVSVEDDGRDSPIQTIEGITIPNWSAYEEVWQSAKDKYIP